MSLSQELILTKVRNRTGLTPNDVPDDLIQDAAESALTELSFNAPLEVFGFFPTIAGVQDYQFPDGTLYQGVTLPWTNTPYNTPKVTSVRDVFFDPGGTSGLYPFFDGDLPVYLFQDSFNTQFGGNFWESPSLGRVLFTKIQAFRNSYSPQASIILGKQKLIRLVPTPTQASVAAFWGTGPYESIEDIDDSDTEAYLKAVLWKVAEARAMQLAVVDTLGEAGGALMRPAHAFWAKRADKYEQDFLDDIGANVMGIFRG